MDELEEKNKKKMKEAGHDASGEPSPDALRQWLIWAGIALGICAAVACILAAVTSGQNRKAAVIMEAEAEGSLTLTLNRKGSVLRVQENAGGIWENAETKKLERDSLEEVCWELLDILAGQGYLDSDGAALFTVRPEEEGCHVDVNKMAGEIGVYAESFLKKKQKEGTVYVGVISEDEEIRELAETYGCSLGKAALVRDLTDRNSQLRTSRQDHLCRLSMDIMHEAIEKRKYTTSFAVVTAGRVYQVKTEEIAMPETEWSSFEENASEASEETELETEEESRISETSAPETEADETREPEATEPEITEPETTEPETTAHETTESETTVSETKASETKASETKAFETKVPETKAAETTTPETKAPETRAQETAAPETSAALQPASPISTAPAMMETATLAPAPVAQTPLEPAPEPSAAESSAQAPSGISGPGQGYVEKVVPIGP